jgi:tRNA-Thr(GGU) m(6)t(6)A37 methyltransferase TsaA
VIYHDLTRKKQERQAFFEGAYPQRSATEENAKYFTVFFRQKITDFPRQRLIKKPLDKADKKGYTVFVMENSFIVKPIAHIRTDFKEKFGIPRQSGRAPSLLAKIVFEPEYATEEAFREIEGFSHSWLIFDFSLAHRTEFSPTVRPPRLGGDKRVGVFASRSPFRPNPIGLSCVKLVSVEHTKTEGTVLIVSGADLLDNTPILDVKPYLPYADCVPEALGGYTDTHQKRSAKVVFPEELLAKVAQEKRAGLCECLAEDPRPSYQDDPKRVYGMRFADFDIKFTVENGILTVTDIL